MAEKKKKAEEAQLQALSSLSSLDKEQHGVGARASTIARTSGIAVDKESEKIEDEKMTKMKRLSRRISRQITQRLEADKIAEKLSEKSAEANARQHQREKLEALEKRSECGENNSDADGAGAGVASSVGDLEAGALADDVCAVAELDPKKNFGQDVDEGVIVIHTNLKDDREFERIDTRSCKWRMATKWLLNIYALIC